MSKLGTRDLQIFGVKKLFADFLSKWFLYSNQPIPLPDIIQFIIVMATYSTFPKLDLFFRKIMSAEWESREATNTLQKLKNVKYILTKESLHIQKTLPLEDNNLIGNSSWNIGQYCDWPWIKFGYFWVENSLLYL